MCQCIATSAPPRIEFLLATNEEIQFFDGLVTTERDVKYIYCLLHVVFETDNTSCALLS